MRGFFVIFIALAATHPPAFAETLAGPYSAQILRVIDGDTVEARVRVWLGLDATVRIRLRGIDAAELRGSCPADARAARDALAELLADGRVTLTGLSPDKFGTRIDAAMALPSGTDVATAMLAAGHARPWSGRKGDPACRLK